MIKAKLEVIFNLYRTCRESSHLTEDEAFGALQSIFGELSFARPIFDRFNQKEMLSVHDLAILLIRIDTYIQLFPSESLLIAEKKEKRGRSLIRAFSNSMRRMVSRGPESTESFKNRVSIRGIDVESYLFSDPSVKADNTPTTEIPPPRTPEEAPTVTPGTIATVSDLVERLEKLEKLIYMKEKS
jgi:hypothetical protein